MRTLKGKLSPGGYIATGFFALILLGTVLLLLPVSQNEGVSVPLIDALFISTSCVCVTGLVSVDPATVFSLFGRTVMAILIQVGGLGVASAGIGIIMLTGRKINIRERVLIKESLNYNSFKGILLLLKSLLIMTFIFEITGMIFSFIVFYKDYTFPEALGYSAFHSIASFNNAGFDLLGGNLAPYYDNVLFNLTTCMLIIFGGMGFYVMSDIVRKKSFKKLSLHSKVVLSTTAVLLAGGTLLLKATEELSWLGAFFFSTSARTAGFAIIPVGKFTNAGLFLLIILMFIGASPGSTGGGIKTTTFYILFRSLINVSENITPSAFKRKFSQEIIRKSMIIILLALSVVVTATFMLCITEPEERFIDLLFEAVSGFGTVGFTAGVTTSLSTSGKLIIICTMFIGRIGPLTVASLWILKPQPDISYVEESIAVG